MSDTEADKIPGEQPKEPEAKHPAKPGVKDVGHNVTTALGQGVDGRIADIADGD